MAEHAYDDETARSNNTHDIPPRTVVSIEHPGIIRNFDKGLKSLGGEAQLKHVLEHHVGDSKLSSKHNLLPEPVVGLSLRPDDPLAKILPSVGVETRNILVKVSLPKRTGRKRKRGSNEPFTEPECTEQSPTNVTASEMFQILRDTEGRYSVEPVGMVRNTHRFRTLPDFQLRNADLPIMRELRDHVMMPDYNKLKDFTVSSTASSAAVTAFPGPPSFTSTDLAHKYEYQQAAAVIFVQDETGTLITRNVTAPPKRFIWNLPVDVEKIPEKPPDDLPPRPSSGEMLLRAIEELEKLLADRPLVTKRVALNSLPPISDSMFKEASQYVGYSFSAGPWRDSLVKYGVDPRKDPECRFYQTLMFQTDQVALKSNLDGTKESCNKIASSWARPLRHTKDDPTTHIFDGKSITANGKTWQVCDIVEPMLHDLLHTANVRPVCEVYSWGWYYNGTMSKCRIIMKDMIRCLFAGETQPEEDYRILASFPDNLTAENIHLAYPHPKGSRLSDLAGQLRSIAKHPEGTRGGKANWMLQSKATASGETAASANAEDAINDAAEDDAIDADLGEYDHIEEGNGDLEEDGGPDDQ